MMSVYTRASWAAFAEVSDGAGVDAGVARDFRKALAAGRSWNQPRSVLVIGCGGGFAGPSPEYALAAAERELQGVSDLQISRLDLTPEHLAGLPHSMPFTGGQFELIVTFGLAQSIPQRAALFRAVRNLLTRGGAWVMGGEQNPRFHANHLCVRTRRDCWRSMGVTAEDVRAEDALPWESAFVDYVPDLRQLWISTADHLGLNGAVHPLPARWSEAAQTLADRFPLDGLTYSGLWARD